MRIRASMLLLVTMSAPAWSQDVVFADLDGRLIETRVIRQQVVRREGRELTNRIETEIKLVIGPGNKIQQTWSPTAHTARGAKHGETRTSLHTLERPREVTSLGGGHAIFVFDKQTLTWLRTYKGGAFKREFVFAREKEGLTCAATESYAREDGVGTIFLDSFVDGVPTVVVSSKQLSSTCRVTAGKPAATQ